MNKYKAIPKVVDGIYFASTYESQIYRSIIFATQQTARAYKVYTQVPVDLYRGSLMPTRVWKCDFAIEDTITGKAMLVEAKGAKQREFSYIVNLLASNNIDAFLALTLVTENESFTNCKTYGSLNIKDSYTFHEQLLIKLHRGIHGSFSL